MGSPAPSTHSYPVPSPATDPTSFDIPVGDTESRRSSSSKESDKKKRKRSTTKSTASKSTRRTSRKAIKQETAPKSLRIAEAKPSQLLNLQNSLLPSQTTSLTITEKKPRRETESPPTSSASRSARTRRSFGLTRKTWSRPTANYRAL
jgi:hypothetical protein